MPSLGPAEILVILVIALLVFGPNKMPDIAKQVGKGFREFRRVQQHLKSELRDVVSEFDSPLDAATVEQQAVPMLPPKDAPPQPSPRPTSPRRRRPRRRPAAAARRRRVDGARSRAPRAGRTQRTRLIRPVPFRNKVSNPEGRMTVFEHLGELRRRLMISIVAAWWSGPRSSSSSPPRSSAGSSSSTTTRHPKGTPNKFIFTGPLDAFATRLKIATYGGIVLALPVWLWQLWRFITPGLNPQREEVRDPVHRLVDRPVRDGRRSSRCSRSSRR